MSGRASTWTDSRRRTRRSSSIRAPITRWSSSRSRVGLLATCAGGWIGVRSCLRCRVRATHLLRGRLFAAVCIALYSYPKVRFTHPTWCVYCALLFVVGLAALGCVDYRGALCLSPGQIGGAKQEDADDKWTGRYQDIVQRKAV